MRQDGDSGDGEKWSDLAHTGKQDLQTPWKWGQRHRGCFALGLNNWLGSSAIY